jgi:hypothetical protein
MRALLLILCLAVPAVLAQEHSVAPPMTIDSAGSMQDMTIAQLTEHVEDLERRVQQLEKRAAHRPAKHRRKKA